MQWHALLLFLLLYGGFHLLSAEILLFPFCMAYWTCCILEAAVVQFVIFAPLNGKGEKASWVGAI